MYDFALDYNLADKSDEKKSKSMNMVVDHVSAKKAEKGESVTVFSYKA